MHHAPNRSLLYLAVGAQGFLGYGLASLFGPIPAEIFAGRRYATILGALSVTGNLGAGLGPWITGYLHDLTGSYVESLWVIVAICPVSALCIWIAAPRKVRRIGIQAAERA
jgi:nitrate/nitrite transporter NarK